LRETYQEHRHLMSVQRIYNPSKCPPSKTIEKIKRRLESPETIPTEPVILADKVRRRQTKSY